MNDLRIYKSYFNFDAVSEFSIDRIVFSLLGIVSSYHAEVVAHNNIPLLKFINGF
jgi:hypothetical protein